jgi:two-component system nitrate/nitrite response regulator NarL
LNSIREHKEVLLVIGFGDDHRAMIEQIELFKADKPNGRVAVVADRQHPSEALAAFRAGSNAYFARGTSGDAFIKSLDLVLLGETLMPATLLTLFPCSEQADNAPLKVAAPLARNDETPQFSEQERRILRNLVEGDSNKIIARKVSIAEATVKVHIKAILRKLRLHNRTQAAVWAMNSGSFDSVVSTKLERLIGGMQVPVPFSELPHLSANLVASE